MKKIIALAFALFFAVTAAAQNYASQKIVENVENGHLKQTVFAGDEIESVKIVYENTGFGENVFPENEGTTDFSKNFGLSKAWTKGPACVISGKMRDDIIAGTYKAYIVVHDDEGKLFKTELTFIVEEKPLPPISLELSDRSGEADQNVEAGKTITPIVFDYEGITSYSVSGLPSGLTYIIDEANQIILITGTVDKDIMSGDYEYKVTVENDAGGTASQTGKISVTDGEGKTDIEIFENETQKVVAGNEIKPVVFVFKNVRVDENLSSFNTSEGSLKGTFNYSVNGNKLTVSGTVDENMQDDTYSIKIIVKGENNCDTAFASVEVTHKPVVTKVTILENASQKVTEGDSIKPIVFYREHALRTEMSNFPGGYRPITSGDTVTIIGLIQEGSSGLHNFVLSVFGPDNQASAKATIEVIPGTMAFDLVEGSDNQTVVAGQDITPIVYQYKHVKKIDGKGIPQNLKVEQDKEKKQVKISGTVDPKSATHEYVYTFDLTDYYGNTKTVSGKVNVLASIDEISSSSKVSSSSNSVASSSSTKPASSSSSVKSSSSVAQSSSSIKTSSSSVKSSSSAKPASSSSSVKSSSSVAQSSSSIKTSSSSVKSSSSAKPASSSSSVKSSSSVAQSSSSTKTSSSSVKSSSSSDQNEESSSSFYDYTTSIRPSDKGAFVSVVMNGVNFGYANNVLTVALSSASMVRVQVFDLTGHLVESLAESMVGSKSYSLAHLNRGSYLVRVESGSQVRSARIVVK